MPNTDRADVWDALKDAKKGSVLRIAHTCRTRPNRKCALHQTLTANQRKHNLKLRVFHHPDLAELWAVVL